MGDGYISYLSSLRDVSRSLCVFKVEVVFFAYFNVHCKYNIKLLIFYMASPMKCHNSVSFKPIFNFKKAIES